jgi:1-acyl-sn-glycerol-3-phosphate acyltransferase
MFSLFQINRRAKGLSIWHVLFWWTIVIWFLRVCLFILYRYRSHGKHYVPRSGPILFVANHQSNFDPAIVGVLVHDRPFKGIAKEELFHSKLLARFMNSFGAISVKRGESDTSAIRQALKELDAGRCVMMFPEGTRTTDGTVGPFQRGFWLLLKKSKATIVPVGFDGAFDAYPMGSKPKLHGRIEVAAGKPLKAEDLLQLGEEEGTAIVRDAIITLQQQCQKKTR